MRQRIAVIGTGMWGTTLAIHLARKGLATTLWARSEEEAASLSHFGENKTFLPDIPFPSSLQITSALETIIPRARLVILAVPAQSMRVNIARVTPYLRRGTILLSATKGIEMSTSKRMSEVLREEVPPGLRTTICVVSGPNLAREIAKGLPATTVVASDDLAAARWVQETLMTPSFRVYTNPDVVGVELGGALKNIIAIGAGASDGFRFGDNAKAAFMIRGLAEITRLGVAMGANPLTFGGLAGVGDLIATCASPYSRNRHVGEELAKGRKLAEILAAMPSVAEGVDTTAAAKKLADEQGIDMPITQQTFQVLFAGKPPLEALHELMIRPGRSELAGLGPLGTVSASSR